MDTFSPGSIQAVWTVLFNLGVDATAADLEVILLQSIMNQLNGDGVLITGTQTLGNLTLIVDTVDIDSKYILLFRQMLGGTYLAIFETLTVPRRKYEFEFLHFHNLK